MLKKIVLGVVALMGVLVLGAVLLVSLVDVNQYKPQIEQAVKDKTRRTLRIDGDLKLSVFPRLALELPRTTLSNLAGDRPAAGLQSARVSVALLPLLSQRLEIDRVRIDGLTATVERRKDGTTSIDDLIRPDAGQQKQAGASKAGGVPQFDIGGVELTNADLTFADAQTGNTLRLQKLNLRTGRLAPQTRTDVALTGELTSAKPAASVALDAKGDVEFDLAKGAYAASGLQATLKGTLDKQPLEASARAARLGIDPSTNRLQVQALEAALKGRFSGEDADVQVTAPQLEVAADRAAGERLLVTFRTSSAVRQANGRLAAEGISGNASQLQVAKVAVDTTLQQGARRTVAALAGPARASMQAQTLSLPQLAGTVSVEDPALPKKALKLPVSGSVELDMKKETVVAKLAASAEDTKLDARVNVAGFATPRIGFDVNADRLNLDTWLPPEPAAAAPAGASAPDKGGAAKPADPPLDLSALKNLTLNGEARVGQFQARGVKLANLRAVVKAAGGRLDVAPMNAQLYGGSMTASASAQAAGNRLGIDASLANVAIEPLLKDALDKDLLAGRGNVKLAVAGAGATVGALKRSLDGNAALQLRDGSIKGINLAQKLRDAQSLLSVASGGRTDTHASSSTEKTDFSELSASFVIRDGVATNNDLDAKSPLLRLSGAGKIDLGAGTIDYLARVSVVGTLTGQDGRSLDQLRGLTVPVRLSGPFTQLSYGIDYGGVARDALKSRLTEQLQQRLGGGGQNPPQSPSTPDKPASSRDKARDLLKGLLGK